MANLNETDDFPEGIYQLETTDPVVGGPNGIDNLQGKQLASRTRWLKNRIAELVIAIANKAEAIHQHAISAVSGLQAALDGKLNKTGGVMSGFLEVTDGTNGIVIGGPVGFIEITRSDGGAGIDLKSSVSEDRDVRLQAGGDGLNIVTGGDSAPSLKIRVGGNGEAALTLYRQNAVDEGGQADFARALDNATAWSADVSGQSGVTNFRFINTFAGEAVMELLGSNGRVYTKHGVQFQDGSAQNAAGLGFGQSWQNVTASRIANTVYQNTAGRPINVSVRSLSSNTNGSWLQVSADGGVWHTVHFVDNDTSSAPLIVPPNHYYRFVHNFSAWFELR